MFENQRENFLKAAEFSGIDQIPCSITFSPATWRKHGERLESLILQHQSLFDDYKKGKSNINSFGPAYRKGEFTDNWGCVWVNIMDGMEGQVKVNPLADWKAFQKYKAPDSLKKTERDKREGWEIIKSRIYEERQRGFLTWGSTQANIRFFERLHFLRGINNLMVDFFTEPPQLSSLTDMIIQNNLKEIHKWLEIGVDVMGAGDDLGTQKNLMISPKLFRKYLFPGYVRMFSPIRQCGAHVYFHTDGYVLEIVDDLIESGVTVLNLQYRANRIDNIEKTCKGKICVAIGLDQQSILPHGNAQKISKHIKEIVSKIGSRQGGLMLRATIYPDVPFNNIEAVCQAMEEYRSIFS